MNMITQAPKRLPSDAGITFVGYEDIKISSRELVRERLQEFMNFCRTSNKPTARVILGEWGEGKTDAFGRYIKRYAESHGDAAFAVSASTISNSMFETDELRKLIQTTPLEAIRFLGCLLYAVREESNMSEIYSPSQFDDMTSYVHASLSNLINENPKKRIFIFIDEFEELLTSSERMIKIISGLKETINGLYREINEGGKFEGCLHFIIAVTPDAWYQLQVRDDTEQIFGGLGRRITQIDLPEVSKFEAIHFLTQLTEYSYEGNLPKQLPIKNLGIFNVIYRVTQGNPGNMVSLYTKLMNNAKIDEEKMNVIDYERLLKFLSREQIFVYGGNTPCLEYENLNRFIRILSERNDKTLGELCSSLLKLLLGELKPFSLTELQHRLKYQRIHNLISIINNILNRAENIPRAIIKLYRLREDKGEEDILNAFKNFIISIKDEQHIKIDNYLEPIKKFKERIYYPEDNGKYTAYLPADEDNVRSFFEGCSEHAREISSIIAKKLCAPDEEYYIASEDVLTQVYPTPVPRELDFMKTRENRMKLWRDTTKNLGTYFDDYIITSLLELGKQSGILSFEELEGTYPKGRKYLELYFERLKIRTLFVSINGDVNSVDIEEIHGMIRGTKPHAVILIYTGEITAEANDMIANKGLDKSDENAIIFLRVHPTLAKRLISIRRAIVGYASAIREDMLRDIAKKLIMQDLDLPNTIRKWLKECEQTGKYINEPYLEKASSISELVGGLKFFINALDVNEDVDKIFELNRRLRKFISFGTKKYSLYPDISLPELRGLKDDLVKNGFLSEAEGKVRVKSTPAEERLVKLLKEMGKATENDLTARFILEKPRLIADLLIPILQHKGIVIKEDSSWKLTTFNDRRNTIDGLIKQFESECRKDSHRLYGCLYITKQRDETTIVVGELRNFITNMFDKINNEYDQTLSIQKLFILEMLLNHFREELHPLIEDSFKEGKKILSQANSIMLDTNTKIDKIRSDTDKWFRYMFDSVREFEELKVIVERLEKIHNATEDEVKRWIDDEIKKDHNKRDLFRFDKDKSEAAFYSPKLFKMRSCWNELQQKWETIKDFNSEFESIILELEQEKREVIQQLSSLEANTTYQVSRRIIEAIRKAADDILMGISPLERKVVKLSELLQDIKKHKPNIIYRLRELSSAVQQVQQLQRSEQKLQVGFSYLNNTLSKAKLFFGEKHPKIEELDRKSRELEKELLEISEYFIIEESSEVGKTIDKTRNRINQITEKTDNLREHINRLWRDYKTSKQRTIKVLRDMMRILGAKYRELEFSDIKNKISSIERFFSPNDITLVERSSAELDEMMKFLEDNFHETVKKLLDDKEILVFRYLLTKTRHENPWLSLSSFEDMTQKELGIQSDELEVILSRLVDKELCERGITIAFYARREEPACTHEDRRLINKIDKRAVWECPDCGQRIIEEE